MNLTNSLLNEDTSTFSFAENDYTYKQAPLQHLLVQPKKALTSYASFCKERYQIIKKNLGSHSTHSDIMNFISQEWKKMNDVEKEPYVAKVKYIDLKKSEEDKERFRLESEAYKEKKQLIAEAIDSDNNSITIKLSSGIFKEYIHDSSRKRLLMACILYTILE